MAAGDAFARQFYEGPAATPYGRFRDIGSDQFGDPLLGFHQRVNQIEQFLLERRFWSAGYPAEIAALGEALTRLARAVLCSVLTHVGIPERDWRRATGGCSRAEGSYHLTFNHYRPAREEIGLSSHKDDGFLTILRTTAPGLEVSREDHWETVPADPGCFIVNFGLSMEILTASSRMPVAAIMHRVARQQDDRSSFGHFSSSGCLPGEDEGIYRYVHGSGLERVCGSRELIDENDYEIYAGTDAPEPGTPEPHVPEPDAPESDASQPGGQPEASAPSRGTPGPSAPPEGDRR
ncbi:2OG-Fe(II) oxygenase family protein [Streptomyces sp. NPDC059063]|uniref:2OG-Fe(II) oxygenase family protein n=1 Tax=Streptomyces sp. NPDC059063 TaxID=3346712 RepID=UPI0036ADE8AD